MNAPERIDLPDIQSSPDDRDIAIDAVGISGLRHPLTVCVGGKRVATVGTWSLSVTLPRDKQGHAHVALHRGRRATDDAARHR